MMRNILFAALAAAAFAFAPAAQAQADPAAMAPIKSFTNAFNTGDLAAIFAAHAETDLTIIDEVPPHIWRGPKAVAAWLVSLAAHDKAVGRTDGGVSVGDPQVVTTEGDRGYAVVPAVYTFKEKGVAMREPATITFALLKTAKGWQIAGWTWNGTVPAPVAAK